MNPGAYVIDSEDDDPDLAVVLHRPEETIAEWTVTDGEDDERTVAADNPDYDPAEPVTIVAFVESGLDGYWSEWTDASPDELYEGARSNEVKCYAFPDSRLDTVSDTIAEFHRETSIDVLGLRSRLEDAGWTIESDDQHLIVEKAGDQYRISPSGDVDGAGGLRTPLANIVEKYVESE